MKKGSLVVVGTGYGGAGQITRETESVVRSANVVFYLVADPIASHWIREVSKASVSLHDSYREGRSGAESCEEMVERIIADVRRGMKVCAAFYGHPCIFVHPGRESVRRARA